ncbi:hypothetical protein Rsub_00606 [Raphidocelis subcapitata]|uniref:Uncharacterized protein n=1 Tax=Raphidocelis subcapitata TaxID=307507 RepID=A0A2V0NKM7_9CHLO|nr:hypothetical protein Rsub_00606 [Raphidocelis subcapitata]|eukprot:GBF87894.1 hypothetical protein Rsub_00606 [Raphidocelis subcapitata]
MAAPSAFQGLSILVADCPGFALDSSPRSYRSDVTTPRTWSALPSRAASIEPAMAPIERDVVDVRGSRDQTRRKPRFSSNQIPDVMPVDRWD